VCGSRTFAILGDFPRALLGTVLILTTRQKWSLAARFTYMIALPALRSFLLRGDRRSDRARDYSRLR
jgi:hypothetical protein